MNQDIHFKPTLSLKDFARLSVDEKLNALCRFLINQELAISNLTDEIRSNGAYASSDDDEDD